MPGHHAEGLKLDHKRLAVGEWMIAAGTGYQAGEKVQVVLYSAPLVVESFTADASGQFRARFKIPKALRLGTHTAEATGWTSHRVTNETFDVVSYNTAAGVAFMPPWAWLIALVAGLTLGAVITILYFRRMIAGWFGGVVVPREPAT
ncbi:MAG TPA: hypothetical protein VNT53_03080 [Pseudolysinimonas sp.]|nr:hypothetical protein [Pseudolysinimonas sp.]